jgi:dimethylargininase
VRFSRALVRPPTPNFAEGLTRASLGAPSFALAMEQHQRYCEALAACGLEPIRLAAEPEYPDATFVEDTAIVTGRGAIVMRPGAATRLGEVASVETALADLVPVLGTIEAPGTVDGGDVCEAGDRFFIGISERTDEPGARQLAGILANAGYEAKTIDIRGVAALLHLKSGLAALHDGRLVAVDALAGRSELAGFDLVRVEPAELYAANCIDVNGRVLLAQGFPKLTASLRALGYDVVTLAMTEFEKMDGGLSCLSLRL